METTDTQTQEKIPEITNKLKIDGELIDFEGNLNNNSQELIKQALQQIEYYRTQSHQLKVKMLEIEQSKLRHSQQYDGIVVIFCACVLVLLTFFSYTIVSGVAGYFNNQSARVK